MHLMTWSTHEVKMLLDIPSPMNDVICDQLDLMKLVDICFDNTPFRAFLIETGVDSKNLR